MSQSIPLMSPLMKANVNAILNKTPDIKQWFLGISPTCTITERPKSTCYYIEFVFHNSVKDGLSYTDTESGEKKESFEFTPVKLTKFVIEQDFVTNYINHFEVNVSLTVDQYQMLFYNYKDLKCDVKFYAADAETEVIYGKTWYLGTNYDPIFTIENAYCLFKDKQDLLKKVPKESVIPSTPGDKTANNQDQMLENILFQIVPTEDYKFRVATSNAIFNECTVEEAIWGIANATGCIDAIMLVTPDNKTKYENLVIPPILSVVDTLNFLQQYYGVYDRGINYFYQLGVLYVYPLHETKPILPKDKSEKYQGAYTKNKYATVAGSVTLDEMGDGGMCHVYMAGNGSYTGQQYYHGFEGSTIHIVSNSKAVFKDMADEGIENIAYSYMVQHTDRVIDDWRTIMEAKSGEEARYGVYAINLPASPNTEYMSQDDQNAKIGLTSNLSHITYVFDKGNRFMVHSNMNAYRKTMAQFDWNMAVPFTFRPGYRICYHYDGEDETARDLSKNEGESLMYCTKNGTVESVRYEFDITKQAGNTYIHSCKATVVAALELETTYHKDGI